MSLDEGEQDNEIMCLKTEIQKKFRFIRRSKNSRIGVTKYVSINVPMSKKCFQANFWNQVDGLKKSPNGSIRGNILIDEMAKVLGSRWHIGQTLTSSTQARVISNITLKYFRKLIPLQQTSFDG